MKLGGMSYQPEVSIAKCHLGLLSALVLSLLCGFTLCFPIDSRAAEQVMEQIQPASATTPASDVSQKPNEPALQPVAPLLSGMLDPVDVPRNYWSNKFVTFANDIDRFFGDPRYFQETNKSVLQLSFANVQQPGGSGNGVIGLDGQAKLDLPSSEKRFSLMLESNPEKNISGDITKQPVASNDVATGSNQSAALRVDNPSEESPWHFSADTGVRVRLPLEPFVRTRASYTRPFEQWRMKAAETLFWFSSIGAGETTQIDFERAISEPTLFRATTTATWMNDTHNFDLRQDFSVYHTLNERSAWLYQAGISGVSEPQFQTTAYVLLMLWRYRLHRSWVFVELSPQLHFPRAKNFEPNPLLLLRLEVLFDSTK